jgi:lipopolysaccharide transport system ATP-binding protein
MSKPAAIDIRGLSKMYLISHTQEAAYATFRDVLTNVLKRPASLITGRKAERERFWALQDVTLKIEQGDVVGIVGRNGSGKSTLLKVLSRIVEPTKGEAILRGRVASLLEVGTGFHPELTGRENVFFNGAILGMSQQEIRSKFDAIVEFSEVEQFLDTPVKFYSSGMYVRLAFAIAAYLDPDILIVDEVLAVGDAAFQEKCLGKMKDVASDGRTVLFVSHNMSSVRALCTKAIWMEKGRVKEVGDLETVTNSYSMSMVKNAEQDLAKRVRTTHVTGEAKIVNLHVYSEDQKTELLDSKRPMRIEFTIEAKQAVENIIIHCGIVTGGQMVLRFMSEFTNTSFDLKKGRNKISLITPPTNLAGGVYSIDCSILHPGEETLGHIDEIFEATSFAVQDYEVPAGKSFITQREATYYLEHRWEQ